MLAWAAAQEGNGLNATSSVSHVDPRSAVSRSGCTSPPPIVEQKPPNGCSSTSGVPVKPSAASRAASTPDWAAWPECRRLTIAPRWAPIKPAA